MIEFKLFNKENLKTDMYGNFVELNIVFVDEKSLLRFGRLREDRGVFYVKMLVTNETHWISEDTLYSEVMIEL